MKNKKYILNTTITLMQTLKNMGVEFEEEDLTFEVLNNHITNVVKKLTIPSVGNL